MSVIHRFREYLLEEEFEVQIKHNQIHIINFTKIGHFDSNKVMIYYEKGSITVEGNKLVVSKLMQDEVLITGDVKKLEFR